MWSENPRALIVARLYILAKRLLTPTRQQIPDRSSVALGIVGSTAGLLTTNEDSRFGVQHENTRRSRLMAAHNRRALMLLRVIRTLVPRQVEHIVGRCILPISNVYSCGTTVD